MVNGFDVGHFGFFRDAELKLRLDEDNLYDQIDANGWVTVWFGGQDVWLPDYGLFNVHMTCDKTFFWDIIDENGKRTKTGFDSIHIPYNPHFESYTGDLIPDHPDQVFENTYKNPATEESQLICSNLWFYTNYFDDDYYRYNLLVLKRWDTPWPNEIMVDIRPMNDKLKIMPDEYIVGYRPKIDYMNQLAILRKFISGSENKIQFKMKVDLEFLAENPTAKRNIKIFTMEGDHIEYLLYPRNEKDIIWRHHGRGFLNEYQRYLLQYGVMQYLPDDNVLDWGDTIYADFMKASNYVLKMDSSNFVSVATDIDMILGGDEKRHLAGYSRLIIPNFLKWFNENLKDDIVRDIETILYRVILTKKYFKGFQQLDEYIGNIIGSFAETTSLPTIWDGNIEVVDGNYIIANGGELEVKTWDIEAINIIIIDGVRQFEDGYVPTSAEWYLNPTRDGYAYAGAIGNGLYKIRISEVIVDVFCDMSTDGGGWMYVITSERTSIDYIKQFGDTSFIVSTMYSEDAFGIGWGKNDGEYKTFQSYNMPFSEVKCKISGEYDNPVNGTGYLDFFTASDGNIVKFIDSNYNENDGQSLFVDGVELISNSQENLVKYDISSDNGSTGDINVLTIKMRGDSNLPYCRRFIYMLAIR